MKKSFELEDSFRSLNHIPRSDTQKRKTYHNILDNGRPKKEFQQFFRSWTVSILTFTMLLISSAFLYMQIITPSNSQQSSMKPADHFAAGKVVRTYLNKSDPDYFTLQTNLTRPGITILDDENWMGNINKALTRMTAQPNAPTGKKIYDFLIVFEGREPAECKLWVNERQVYLKELKSEQVFKIETGQAGVIIKTIEDIEKRVRF
ncbi:hypothetical protein AABM38_07390 [Heyndrickxia sp. MSNUG]|uniref:hypothetical protein n=1 Tax=Heyndrickxia sp. MSNUG TaxID=3136677 RepID=UPI003C2F2723